MLVATVQHNMEDIQPLVKTLICEADCTTLKPFPVPGFSGFSNQGLFGCAGFCPSFVKYSVKMINLNLL